MLLLSWRDLITTQTIKQFLFKMIFSDWKKKLLHITSLFKYSKVYAFQAISLFFILLSQPHSRPMVSSSPNIFPSFQMLKKKCRNREDSELRDKLNLLEVNSRGSTICLGEDGVTMCLGCLCLRGVLGVGEFQENEEWVGTRSAFPCPFNLGSPCLLEPRKYKNWDKDRLDWSSSVQRQSPCWEILYSPMDLRCKLLFCSCHPNSPTQWRHTKLHFQRIKIQCTFWNYWTQWDWPQAISCI